MSSALDLKTRYCAHNDHPMPVELTRGAIVWKSPDNRLVAMLDTCHARARQRIAPARIASRALADILAPATELPHA